MQEIVQKFRFYPNWNFATEPTLFYEGGDDNPVFFELLDGTNFLLLDGSDFLLLASPLP